MKSQIAFLAFAVAGALASPAPIKGKSNAVSEVDDLGTADSSGLDDTPPTTQFPDDGLGSTDPADSGFGSGSGDAGTGTGIDSVGDGSVADAGSSTAGSSSTGSSAAAGGTIGVSRDET